MNRQLAALSQNEAVANGLVRVIPIVVGIAAAAGAGYMAFDKEDDALKSVGISAAAGIGTYWLVCKALGLDKKKESSPSV
jgi:hypothetical protein